MKGDASRKVGRAFTLVELLVIIATLIVVAVLWIPTFVGTRHKATTKICINNLKEVGLACSTRSLDSYDNPVRVATNSGGTKELVDRGQVFVHFQAISNELITPKALICPLDTAKVVATNFNTGFSDRNVSYFVGTDASDTTPQMFLSGDRNLASEGQPIKPGLFDLTTNIPLTWTKAIHGSCGNILFADGSVQFSGPKKLTTYVQNQDDATNRLVIP